MTAVTSTTTAFTETSEEPKFEDTKQKWLGRAKDIPQRNRKEFAEHMNSLFRSIEDTQSRIPQWSASAKALSQIETAAQDIFSRCQVFDSSKDDPQKHFASISKKIEECTVAFTPFQAPVAASKAPERDFMFAYRQQRMIEKAANAKMMATAVRVVDTAVEKTVKAAAQGIKKAVNAASEKSEAIKRVRNVSQSRLLETVSKVKSHLHESGVTPKIKKCLDNHAKGNEQTAQMLAKEYDLPLQSMRDFVSDSDTVLFAAATGGAMGLSTKGLGAAARGIRSGTKASRGSAATVARTVSETPQTVPSTIIPTPTATPASSSLIIPEQASTQRLRLVPNDLPLNLQNYRDLIADRIQPLNLPTSKGEIAFSAKLTNGVYNAKVDFLSGKVNMSEVITHLKSEAVSKGATTLKIEAVIVNEKLYNVLKNRYNFSGGFKQTGYFEIPLN